ncbi:MAG: putative multicopper oxidase [Actinomycetia bacterium]|nr:putative multicopper oxidase [Actinomycetes bacterium]
MSLIRMPAGTRGPHALEVNSPMSSIDRRSFLRAGLAGTVLGAAVTGCGAGSPAGAAGSGLTGPDSPQVAAAEAARYKTGRVVPAALQAIAGPADLGGVTVHTWSYGGEIPGPEIRVRRGDVIQAVLASRLPQATTVHWHGIAIRDNMDGVPGLTQAPVAPGRDFTYRFTAEDPGTYWYHPHAGTQLDRGLYGPLIVEDPREPAAYDHDWTVILDDWIDGTGYTSDQVLASLRSGMSGMSGMSSASPSPAMPGMSMPPASPSPVMPGMNMPGMSMPGMTTPSATASPAMTAASGGPLLSGAASPLLGGDAGDVRYPYYLINGRVRTAPRTFTARPGQRARIRFINAGADTAFRVALGGHAMTVTHTDGYPVSPVQAGALLIAMGERYDVQVTLGDGVFPLTALAEGKGSTALALVRTGAGSAPPATVRPAELGSVLTGYGALRPADSAALTARQPDITHRLELTGGMARYNWGINGQSFDMASPGAPRFLIRQGQRVRVVFANTTAMYHPMHIHGHTFQLGGSGPRKDTVIVLPGRQVACDFEAINPGQWMTHCHNLYHAPESGMMAILGYQA